MRTTVVLVPIRNLSWNVESVVRLVTSKGIAVVVKGTTQMLVVREMGLRTNPKTKVDAIAWWINSSATTHVCKDRCWFKTFEPVEDGSVLYMVDEHFAPVHGKGSVALECSSEKTVTLFNVLYVPKLRKNLVFGPVLNKCGYKQVYESDKYILSKCGVFVGFGYYNNGHVHYIRMLEISKDELIPAIDKNSDKCTTWFLIKGTKLPPMNFGKRNEGCRAVVRLPDPKRKTLGEKGIECIFVGYAEHSKAYRFYVIEPNDSVSINSIIESRDSIFDENCFYSIPRPKDIISNSDESQRDDHSDDVPSEISEPRKGCKWIFKKKMKVDGTFDKFKARLVIQGFRQKEGIDYFNTYAPFTRITTIRLMLAIAAIHNLVIHQMDVKTAFLNGDLDKKVYMKQLEGFIMLANEHK
nr:zinc finger, CCHC-type [Tanacetum cinerariifolium]